MFIYPQKKTSWRFQAISQKIFVKLNHFPQVFFHKKDLSWNHNLFQGMANLRPRYKPANNSAIDLSYLRCKVWRNYWGNSWPQPPEETRWLTAMAAKKWRCHTVLHHLECITLVNNGITHKFELVQDLRTSPVFFLEGSVLWRFTLQIVRLQTFSRNLFEDCNSYFVFKESFQEATQAS